MHTLQISDVNMTLPLTLPQIPTLALIQTLDKSCSCANCKLHELINCAQQTHLFNRQCFDMAGQLQQHMACKVCYSNPQSKFMHVVIHTAIKLCPRSTNPVSCR